MNKSKIKTLHTSYCCSSLSAFATYFNFSSSDNALYSFFSASVHSLGESCLQQMDKNVIAN